MEAQRRKKHEEKIFEELVRDAEWHKTRHCELEQQTDGDGEYTQARQTRKVRFLEGKTGSDAVALLRRSALRSALRTLCVI